MKLDGWMICLEGFLECWMIYLEGVLGGWMICLEECVNVVIIVGFVILGLVNFLVSICYFVNFLFNFVLILI